ncbi:MAG: DUF1638 domain-containing protein [Chloroflexi bacterium]|nr:DUF1638 domain-containing protein [Chloroflexota bacterium]
MKTAFILCGALGREAQDIVRKHQWEVDLIGISALHHLLPERITPDVESRLRALRAQYARVIVVYGECGTGGALDDLLARYGIERVAGAHCYAMFAGPLFETLLAEEPGTFFLTDFLARAFHSTVIKGLGLDRYPELKEDYFRHYRRVVYLAQRDDPLLRAKAQAAADYLGLPLVVQFTGYSLLEDRLIALMHTPQEAL